MNQQELERRRCVVGASEIGLLFGLPSFGGRTVSDLWYEKKYGVSSGGKGNTSTALGHKLEPIVLEAAEERIGRKIVDRQKWCVRGVNGATLDGRVEGGGPLVEAKTSGILWADNRLSEWGDDGTDEVPDLYLMQVQCQLLVTEAELAYLAALIGGRGFAMYHIPPHKDLQYAIAMKSAEFLATVANDEPPGEPPTLETLKRIRRQPEKIVDRSDEIEAAYDAWEAAKARAKVTDTAKDDAQRRLIALLGDAEAAVCGRGMVTYFEQTRKESVTPESKFRVLRFKKGS